LVCPEAWWDPHFYKVMHYLLAHGFRRDGETQTWLHLKDGLNYQVVIVVPFAKKSTGQKALLRFGEINATEEFSAYALVQKGGVQQYVLYLAKDGTIKKLLPDTATAPNSTAPSGASTSAPATSSADTSLDALTGASTTTDLGAPTYASYMCQYCGFLCGFPAAGACFIAGLVLTKSPKIAAGLGFACDHIVGDIACDDVCKDVINDATQWDELNCGGCGNDSAQFVCAAGVEICCKSTCTTRKTDENNCGVCGVKCGPEEPTCCNGFCWDLNTSAKHCGKCGNACGTGQVCKRGVCVDTECGSNKVTCTADMPDCCGGQCRKPCVPPDDHRNTDCRCVGGALNAKISFSGARPPATVTFSAATTGAIAARVLTSATARAAARGSRATPFPASDPESVGGKL
jgi:hypothetical protein